jgi:Ca2+-binding RTX toxin-like protein
MSIARRDADDFVQPLEPRRLFAAAPLIIDGTALADRIEISQTATAYVVTINGVATSHPIADVSKIDVSSGDGNDAIIASTTLTLGFYANGGNGNDAMIGGSGPDTFVGAAGKDELYGGLGNDRLNGAGGNDKVIGEFGADRCYGGDGNDYLDGGSSGDRIYLGAGMDTAFGASGDDIFYAIDATKDEIYGASGQDTATADSQDIRASIEHIAVI